MPRDRSLSRRADHTEVAARTEQLLRRAAESEGQQREDLLTDAIVTGVPLARTVASRYRERGVDRDDLDQVAFEYLVKAARNYRPSEGSDFRSYALPTIRGGIRHYFRDHAWAVKLPRRLQELQGRISKAEAELTMELGRRPDRRELAAAIGVSVAELDEARRAQGCFQPASLDAPAPHADGGLSLGGLIADPADRYALVEHREALQPAVDVLPARDRLILRRRFVDHRTQDEIGAEIGVSQMQVCRLLNAIMKRLQVALTT